MVDSKMISTNRILNTSRMILEIMMQCIVYVAMTAFVMVGLCDRKESELIYSLLIIVPVLVFYYSRKRINTLFLFITIHVMFMISAALLGNTEAESTFFLLCVIMVSVRSISLKLSMVRKSEYDNIHIKSKDLTDDSEDMKKLTIMAGERMNVFYLVVMIIGYFIGAKKNSEGLMAFEVGLFIAFVLITVVYNQVKELNLVFENSAGKSEFPSNRIINVNVIITIVICLLMILSMLLFYNGKYGNIFTLIGAVLYSVARFLLKIILFLWKKTGSESDSYENEAKDTEKPDAELDKEIGDIEYDNGIMQAIFEALAFVLIVVCIGALIYALIRYSRKFKNTTDNDEDEVIFLNEKEKAKKTKNQKLEKASNQSIPANLQYRKIYKKKVKSKKKNIDKAMQPELITKDYIVKDEKIAGNITESYEKARYSKDTVTKEEIDYLKKI